jgi:hypothetical protein
VYAKIQRIIENDIPWETYLFDFENDENPIAQFVLDQNARIKTFTNLTSAKFYYLVASDINAAVMITISD